MRIYDMNAPYRLWAAGNPFCSYTDAQEAIDGAVGLVRDFVDPEEIVIAESRHTIHGTSLLEFRLDDMLLCVLYGATWTDWQSYGPECLKPN